MQQKHGLLRPEVLVVLDWVDVYSRMTCSYPPGPHSANAYPLALVRKFQHLLMRAYFQTLDRVAILHWDLGAKGQQYQDID